MYLAKKWNPHKKPTNFQNWFVIMFWLSLFLGLINIIVMTCYVFINPSDAKNVVHGQKLYLGFYNILVGDINASHLSPIGIVMGVSVVLNTATCIIAYWNFRHSHFSAQIDNVHVSSVMILIVVFLCLLFIINIFNRPILDYKNLDIIKNGWNTDITNDNYFVKFNYVYDVHLINAGGSPINTVFVFSRFFYIWVISITSFWVILFIFIVALFYNSNVSISMSTRRI